MEPYNLVPVLFWLGYVSKEGDLTYQIRLGGEKEDVTPLSFMNTIINANILCYPIICLN